MTDKVGWQRLEKTQT